MTQFPYYLQIGSASIHPHWIFETLAYFIGFRTYVLLRRRVGDVIESRQRTWVITAAVVGGALGSKALYWLGDPALTIQKWNDPFYLMAGKTVVGGLIGGLFAVELAKRLIGVATRTGDLFAIPLALGIAVGRIGCFLSGLGDDTCGSATGLPWGVDFGDGVPRHPVQLYEICWLLLLAVGLRRLASQPHQNGDVFKTFMVGYLGFRLLIDFLKPGLSLGGLTAIQWSCVIMLVYYWRDLARAARLREVKAHD